MTLKRKDISFEEYDSLSVSNLKGNSTKAVIQKAPRIVKTRYTDSQPVIIVKIGVEIFTWWANWTSLNALISKHGENELEMVGKEIELVKVEQPVEGNMTEVIYLKGSYKKKDS